MLSSVYASSSSFKNFPSLLSHSRSPDPRRLVKNISQLKQEDMTSLIWLTAEEAAKNRGKVLSLYRQLLRSLNSPKLPLSYASRLAKKAEVRTIFLFGSEEISKHNVADLIQTGEYALSQLKQGKIPNNTTQY